VSTDKLLAEWFWTDRWMGSSGFLLPMEQRGLYREMLTQAWRRGARLPNDEEAIRRAIGATEKEWRRCWPYVRFYWRQDGDSLVNDTQLQVYAETQAAVETNRTRAQRGARGRWGRKKDAQEHAQALPEHSLSITQGQNQALPEECAPSPVSVLPPVSPPRRSTALEPGESVRWFDRIYGKYPNKDRKQAAMEAWIALGPDADTASAIYAAIERKLKAGWVRLERRFIPQTYLVEREWEDATPTDAPAGTFDEDPYARLPHAWQCAECGEVHEGTQEQGRQRVCLKAKQAS
jgi:uncharacterized protein YdaU (DUF1376 family)